MQLAVGQVFHLKCRTCHEPKMKFFVIALLDPLRFFLINTKPSRFQAARPDSMAALAPIRQEWEEFLSHDSYVACDSLFAEYDQEELREEIAVGTCCRGSLGQASRQSVHQAIKNNRLLPRKYRAALLESWPP